MSGLVGIIVESLAQQRDHGLVRAVYHCANTSFHCSIARSCLLAM
jgi:hypothetical protein